MQKKYKIFVKNDLLCNFVIDESFYTNPMLAQGIKVDTWIDFEGYIDESKKYKFINNELIEINSDEWDANSIDDIYNTLIKQITHFYYQYRFFDISSKTQNNLKVGLFAGKDDIVINGMKYFGADSLQNALKSITQNQEYEFIVSKNISYKIPYNTVSMAEQKIAVHRRKAAILKDLHLQEISELYRAIVNGEKPINALISYEYNIDIMPHQNNQIITKAENIEV